MTSETTRELRIFGPPGTGKTTRVAREVQRAAERYGSERVLVASFSKAAATELVGRDMPIDRANVGTLHALCYRALGRPEIAERHLAEWNADQRGYALSDQGSDVDEPGDHWSTDQHGDEVFARYQLLRARATPRAVWPESVLGFAGRWEAWKTERGYADFTDLIELGLSSLETAPGSPVVGFFDEAQDFTALEFAVCRQWARHMDYAVFVGDDDQTLYGFRGASPDVFLTPLPAENKRVLAQSYRVPRAVHAYAQQWIARVGRREPKDYQPRDYEGEVRRLQRATWKHPEPLVDDMRRYLEAGKTVMVLASCSYMLGPLLAVLRQHGIPFANPYRPTRGDWNPLARGTEKRQTTVDRLLAYLRPDAGTWGEQAREWTPRDLRSWMGLVRTDGVLRRGAKTEIEHYAGESVSVGQLARWFTDEALAGAWECSPDWMAQAAAQAKAKPLTFPLHVAEQWGGAKLLEEPAVCVGTAHSVKGGERDVVYVLPDLSRTGMEEWLRPGEGRDAVRRLFYVAFTRARESLVLCGPGGRTAVDL
jgi:DNA helicase II / ATP-dependent DNA helicase PcrA